MTTSEHRIERLFAMLALLLLAFIGPAACSSATDSGRAGSPGESVGAPSGDSSSFGSGSVPTVSDGAPSGEGGSSVGAPAGSESTSPGTSSVALADSDSDGDSDNGDSALTVLAVVGFAVLIALAGWWMVRRHGPDDRPYPRPDDEPGGQGDQMSI